MKNITRRPPLAGFTLIEMLTVVAIIGILAGLLLPAISGAYKKAKEAKARTAVYGLATAGRAYYTEYGQWPTGAGAVTTNLFANPRNIVFYEFPAKDVIGGNYCDPWKTAYQVAFDTDYDGQVADPAGGPNINAGVIVWSWGPSGSGSPNTTWITSWK